MKAKIKRRLQLSKGEMVQVPNEIGAVGNDITDEFKLCLEVEKFIVFYLWTGVGGAKEDIRVTPSFLA